MSVKAAVEPNPRISWLLRAVTLLNLVVLVGAGAGLFFWPRVVRPIWPWDIAPYHAAFVGALYLASAPAIAVVAYQGRWSPARVVLPMLLAFAATGLVTSVLSLAQFHFERWSTWVWFFIFTLLPLTAAAYLWRYRRQPPALAQPTPAAWRAVSRVAAIPLLLYGLGQFVAPVTLSGFWPWPVDAFHGRLYSGGFLALAFGLWLTARAASRWERRLPALNLSFFGGLAILGLLTVDATVGRVDWSRPGPWLWIAALAALALLGLAGLWQSLTPLTHAEGAAPRT